MRAELAWIVLALGCSGAQANGAGCPPGRTMLDGVCASDAVADYVACVRSQGAKLGEERSRKLSLEASNAAIHASAADDARERLEKSYATSDANTLEIIRACGAMREGDACSVAANVGTACGFEPDPRFLASCRADPEFQRCAASSAGECNAFSLCGLAQFARVACGGKGAPSGAAGCVATTRCEQACSGDVACVCACTEKAMPSMAHAILLQNQCFDAHCRGCAGAACDACFHKSCSEKFDRACAGR